MPRWRMWDALCERRRKRRHLFQTRRLFCLPYTIKKNSQKPKCEDREAEVLLVDRTFFLLFFNDTKSTSRRPAGRRRWAGGYPLIREVKVPTATSFECVVLQASGCHCIQACLKSLMLFCLVLRIMWHKPCGICFNSSNCASSPLRFLLKLVRQMQSPRVFCVKSGQMLARFGRDVALGRRTSRQKR